MWQNKTARGMNFNLFIARKLFREHGDVKKVSRPAILIATSGVAVGLAVMIISVCVVLGLSLIHI